MLRRRLAADAVATECRGAALFVDISGFTPLTERYSQQGPIGAERLAEVLNQFFGLLIDLIHEHGGDVIDFSGDAVLGFWEGNPAAPDEALAAAARCALKILTRGDGHAAEDDTVLRVKLGLGLGAAFPLKIGRPGVVRKFVLGGEALRRMGNAVALAEAGQVIVHEAVIPRLPGCKSESHQSGHVLLLEVDTPEQPEVAAPIDLACQEETLRDHVIRAVLSEYDAGDTRWISEFRAVSVMFVQFPNQHFTEAAQRAAFEAAVVQVMDVVVPLEGDVLQVLVDDKGAVLEAVFGLPPHSHEEDPLRAVRAALEIDQALTTLGVEFAVGVTTGSAFCGTYGNDQRRHYAVVGKMVNLAARLAARAQGRVLVDEVTRREAERLAVSSRLSITFSEPEQFAAKGVSNPVNAYEPNLAAAAPEQRRGGVSQLFVGRRGELKQLDRALERIVQAEPATTIVEGEAGIGKTMLVNAAADRAAQRGIRVLRASAEAMESNTPYFALRDFFSSLTHSDADGPDEVRERLIAAAGNLAPLLNVVLPLELPETPITRQMLGEVRADATRDLLLRLFADRKDPRPLLVIIENLQWLDSVSWDFVRTLVSSATPVGLLLTHRQLSDQPPAGLAAISDHPDVSTIALKAFDADRVTDLLRTTLKVDQVDGKTAALIAERTEGHPLFVRELALALRESGLLPGGKAGVTLTEEDLAEVVPDNLQGVIASRLDRVAGHRKVTVKVGSVLGRTFSGEVVAGIHPSAALDEPVPVQLEALVLDELLEHEQEAYTFQHVLIRDVAYGQLTFAQRREFHRNAVDWIESHSGGADRQSLATLAHHCRHAELHEKCLNYLEQVGELALADGANRECIGFFEQALEIAGASHAISPLRRARFEQRIGEAHYSAGNVADSERWTTAALTRLGEPLPTSPSQWGWRAAKEGLRQLWHIVRGYRKRPRKRARPERKIAAQAYNVLGEQLYFKNDPTQWLAITLAGINTSECTEHRDLSGRLGGGLGYAMGVGRLDRLARRYLDMGYASETDVKARGIAHCGEANWHIAFARWEEADEVIERGIELARAASDYFSLGFAHVIHGQGKDYRGDLHAAKACFAEGLKLAREQDNHLYLAWFPVDLAGSHLGLGELDEAMTLLDAADAYVWDADSFSDIRYCGVRAGVRHRQGRFDEAFEFARKALQRMRGKPQFHQSFYWTMSGIIETLLGQLRRAERADAELHALVKESFQRFRGLARAFPFMRSRYARYDAELALARGRPGRAARRMRRALSLAEHYRMTYDQALSHWGCANATVPAFAVHFADQDHKKKARELLQSIGASQVLKTLDAAPR